MGNVGTLLAEIVDAMLVDHPEYATDLSEEEKAQVALGVNTYRQETVKHHIELEKSAYPNKAKTAL